MNRINRTIFYIKGKEILLLHDLLTSDVLVLKSGLAFEHAIDESEVQVIYASPISNCKSVGILINIVKRFADKYTWN